MTFKMRKIIKVMSVAAILSLPIFVFAETVVRSGGDVSIAANQIVENDFYAAGGSVTHSGEVRGDMYVMAGSITVNGKVGEDLTVLGGTVNTHERIGDDLRVLGGEVVVAGEVKGDVFVVGGQLRLLSTAKVGGNIYFYGGEAVIDGPVVGTIMGKADTFIVNAEAGGIDISGKLTLSDRASIEGDVNYISGEDLSRSPSAVVTGQISRGDEVESTKEDSRFGLFMLAAWFFTSFCVFFLFKKHLEQLWHTLKRDPARSSVIGAVALIVGPVLAVILLLTVLGAWFGLLLFVSLSLLILAAFVLLPIVLGRAIVSFVSGWNKMDYAAILVGFVAVFVLSLIPVLGALISILATIVTAGALLLTVYRWARE